jgi:mannitol-specific phosphotransferase system IIBC component
MPRLLTVVVAFVASLAVAAPVLERAALADTPAAPTRAPAKTDAKSAPQKSAQKNTKKSTKKKPKKIAKAKTKAARKHAQAPKATRTAKRPGQPAHRKR